MNFARIDLNLLVSLDALLSECNVTKAAARLHISQPALSAQLAKLREIFKDPLLLPAQSGRGMTATARAMALQGPLRAALKSMEAVLHSETAFDPLRDEKTFNIAISDNAVSAVALPLIASLSAAAGEDVRVAFSVTDPAHIAAHMEEGEIELLIDSQRNVPPNLKAQLLLEEPFVMAQRKRHPRGRRALDLDTYCALRHIVVSSERGDIRGYMDAHLETLGRQRNALISVPQVMMVPDILQASDYVCTLPRMLLAPFKAVLDMFELPFSNEPYRLMMGWHPRNDTDPASKWLRDHVLAVVHPTR
jgi:DNA-binding transcriptional LysR family regulator